MQCMKALKSTVPQYTQCSSRPSSLSSPGSRSLGVFTLRAFKLSFARRTMAQWLWRMEGDDEKANRVDQPPRYDSD